jgi:hypothetical protein
MRVTSSVWRHVDARAGWWCLEVRRCEKDFATRGLSDGRAWLVRRSASGRARPPAPMVGRPRVDSARSGSPTAPLAAAATAVGESSDPGAGRSGNSKTPVG